MVAIRILPSAVLNFFFDVHFIIVPLTETVIEELAAKNDEDNESGYTDTQSSENI